MAFPLRGPTEEAAPWWLLAVNGIVAIAFGILAVAWPAITLHVLVILFGIQAVVTGAVLGVATYKAIAEHRTWWTHMVLAIISIVAGVYVLAYPALSALALLYVVAFWAIVMGVTEIVSAIRTSQFLMFIVGLLGIMVGFVLMANPARGALAFVIVIGIYAIIRGLLLLVQAIGQSASPAAS